MNSEADSQAKTPADPLREKHEAVLDKTREQQARWDEEFPECKRANAATHRIEEAVARLERTLGRLRQEFTRHLGESGSGKR